MLSAFPRRKGSLWTWCGRRGSGVRPETRRSRGGTRLSVPGIRDDTRCSCQRISGSPQGEPLPVQEQKGLPRCGIFANPPRKPGQTGTRCLWFVAAVKTARSGSEVGGWSWWLCRGPVLFPDVAGENPEDLNA